MISRRRAKLSLCFGEGAKTAIATLPSQAPRLGGKIPQRGTVTFTRKTSSPQGGPFGIRNNAQKKSSSLRFLLRERLPGNRVKIIESGGTREEFMLTIPGKACGECSFCCKVLEITEFAKAAGKLCEHCLNSGSGGCGIYAARPQVCRDYECLWKGNRDLSPHRHDFDVRSLFR